MIRAAFIVCGVAFALACAAEEAWRRRPFFLFAHVGLALEIVAFGCEGWL